MSLATGTAADAFVSSEEEQRIRETVATIASRYGRAYMRRCIEEERPPVQLWDEVASTRERVVWDAPIGSHQGVSHPLAEAKIELELARTMTRKACALYDAAAKGAGEAANMAKFAAAEPGVKCVDRAIQSHGGNGVALEYGLADLWWGVRTAKIPAVSREMILNYVAEHSLRLPRSY